MPSPDSDWAALPYAGLRVEADITVWKEAGLNLGVWTSVRADNDFPTGHLVDEGFWVQISKCRPIEQAACS